MQGLTLTRRRTVYGEDLDPGPAMDHYQIRVPPGTVVDGAVVKLALDDRGILTADVRIDGPAVS